MEADKNAIIGICLEMDKALQISKFAEAIPEIGWSQLMLTILTLN